MARYLIRQAHGGESRLISDGALPYFQNQDPAWVVLDNYDDSTDDPPLYLSKAESDLRYAHLGDIGNPDSPTGAELRTFFAEAGTGGGGAVASVNGQTGTVTLTFSDVGAVSDTDPRLSDARTPTSHTHVASQVSDSTTVGQAVMTAADAATARTAIGAGTSSLTLGTTGTTAAAGNDTRIIGASQRTLTKRAVTGAYTLVAADATDMVLHSTAASAVTITLPQDSAATIAQEVTIPWRQYGAGQVTFAAGTGATLISRGSVFRSAGQYAEGVVTKVAANTWLLSGDIVA